MGGGTFATRPEDAPKGQIRLPQSSNPLVDDGPVQNNPWSNLNNKVARPSEISRGASSRLNAPPPINIMAEVQEAAKIEAFASKPAWESKTGRPTAPVFIPGKIHFGKAEDVAGAGAKPEKTALQVAADRKREKKANEEAAKLAAKDAEDNRHAHLPEWKRAMMLKKEASAKVANAPKAAVAARKEEVEHMFDDLPGFMREQKVKAEKRRILQEEGIIL
jgi:hypothetical protein